MTSTTGARTRGALRSNADNEEESSCEDQGFRGLHGLPPPERLFAFWYSINPKPSPDAPFRRPAVELVLALRSGRSGVRGTNNKKSFLLGHPGAYRCRKPYGKATDVAELKAHQVELDGTPCFGEPSAKNSAEDERARECTRMIMRTCHIHKRLQNLSAEINPKGKRVRSAPGMGCAAGSRR